MSTGSLVTRIVWFYGGSVDHWKSLTLSPCWEVIPTSQLIPDKLASSFAPLPWCWCFLSLLCWIPVFSLKWSTQSVIIYSLSLFSLWRWGVQSASSQQSWSLSIFSHLRVAKRLPFIFLTNLQSQNDEYIIFIILSYKLGVLKLSKNLSGGKPSHFINFFL